LAEGRISEDELDAAYDDAVRETITAFEKTGSPVVTDGEQRKPSFATYPIAGLEALAADGVVIPFADGHTRQLPRLTAGPFRYQTYAGSYLESARPHARCPMKQAVISASALSLLYWPTASTATRARHFSTTFCPRRSGHTQLPGRRSPHSARWTSSPAPRPGQTVFVGVTDPIDPRVETPEEVCARVLEAAERLPADQLGTTDDCGFAPFGDDLSTARETAFAKIGARVAGTELASRELGI
jgi:methionine synthase II (cobalamin-independent)